MEAILQRLIDRKDATSVWAYTHLVSQVAGQWQCYMYDTLIASNGGDIEARSLLNSVYVRGLFSSLRKAKQRLRCELRNRDFYAKRLKFSAKDLQGMPEGSAKQMIDAMFDGSPDAENNFDLTRSSSRPQSDWEEWGHGGGGVTKEYFTRRLGYEVSGCEFRDTECELFEIHRYQVETLEVDPQPPSPAAWRTPASLGADRAAEVLAFELVFSQPDLVELIEAELTTPAHPHLHVLFDSRGFSSETDDLTRAKWLAPLSLTLARPVGQCDVWHHGVVAFAPHDSFEAPRNAPPPRSIAAYSRLDDAIAAGRALQASAPAGGPSHQGDVRGGRHADTTSGESSWLRIQACEVDGDICNGQARI